MMSKITNGVCLFLVCFGAVEGALMERMDMESFVSAGITKGVAWLDFDNDGFLDLFLLSSTSEVMSDENGAFPPVGTYHDGLFRNNQNGGFDDVSAEMGIAMSNPNGGDHMGSTSVVAADFNNDDWVDVFVTGTGFGPLFMLTVETDCMMYENLGVDAAGQHLGFTLHVMECTDGLVTTIAAGADLDNDGLVDIVGSAMPMVAMGAPGMFMYRNLGDFNFELVQDSGVTLNADLACATSMTDYDDDGDQDILVAICAGLDGGVHAAPNKLFKNYWMEDAEDPNRSLRFSDVSTEAGFVEPGFFMAFAFGDVDNDGDLDYYTTSHGMYDLPEGSTMPLAPHALYIYEGNGKYVNRAAEMGLANQDFGWGACFLDVDNSGRVDLLTTGSELVSAMMYVWHHGFSGVVNPGTLYRNTGTHRSLRAGMDVKFEIVETYGFEDTITSGMAMGDYDNDGFADAVIMQDVATHSADIMLSGGAFLQQLDADLSFMPEDEFGTGHPSLLHNIANKPGGEGEKNMWIKIKLVGVYSNRGAVGAKVTLRRNPGRWVEQKQVTAGSSFASTNSPILTFGLGAITPRLMRVEVKWPRGGEVETFVLEQTDINSLVTLEEGRGKRRGDL